MTLNELFDVIEWSTPLHVDIDGYVYEGGKDEVALLLERDFIEPYNVFVVKVGGYDYAQYIECVENK